MSDETMKAEHDDDQERLAVCIRQAGEMSEDEQAELFEHLSESEWAEIADKAKAILAQQASPPKKKPKPENKPQYAQTLDNVEVFRAGTWNGDKYSVKDLDDMVSAFERVGFQPPVKLGHETKGGDPAYGWVTQLRRVGDKLVARFENIPDELFKMIKERRFNAVSAEIFWNLARNGEKFRRVLKAVAILGSDVPAVSHLRPLSSSVSFGDTGRAAIHVYQVGKRRRVKPMPKTYEELKARRDELRAELKDEQDEAKIAELNQELDEVVDKLVALAEEKTGGEGDPVEMQRMSEQLAEMQKRLAEAEERGRHESIAAKVKDLRIPSLRPHIEALYDLATREGAEKVKFFTTDDKGNRKDAPADPITVIDDLVKRLNESTEHLFNELGTTGSLKRDDEPEPTENVGAIVDRKTREHMEKNGVKDYSEAMHAVLNADPELARKYART